MNDMKVYVISLPKDEIRREKLKNQFKSYNEFEIIEGKNAQEFSLNEYYSIIRDSFNAYGKLLNPGEIGCAMSHMKALSKFLDDVKNQAGGIKAQILSML